MGYCLEPRSKEVESWGANLVFMDYLRSLMEMAGVNDDIIGKLCFCDGELVKKSEALEISGKLTAFMEANPVFLLTSGEMTEKYLDAMKKISSSVELLGWNGDKYQGFEVCRKGDGCWKEIRGFVNFCRKSNGFRVY